MILATPLDLTRALIARRSLTPDDAGCCALIAEQLDAMGFAIEWMNRDGVTNLWATFGSGLPLTILAGHTDVVPTGPLADWTSDPFQPTTRDGVLYGRGAADMKSGLAAMVCAAGRLIERGAVSGTLAFLITSDEEGPALHGTRYVAEQLRARGVKPDYAIVGEASSHLRLGDRIVVGRRGSLSCELRVIGRQGHVAYPERADNPIHRLSAALADLTTTAWDRGNDAFPATSLQVSNIAGGTGAGNVIPGEAKVWFNFRYSTESSSKSLQDRTHSILDRHLPQYETIWTLSGEPFLTRQGRLIESARCAIDDIVGKTGEAKVVELFTGGGTSDARFLAPLGAEVVEIGPVNASIHKIDEHIRIDDLERLSAIYEKTMEHLFR